MENWKIVPIEVKSGKKYTKHTALNNLYAIDQAYVFYNGNVKVNDKVVYYPIYMVAFVKKTVMEKDRIYRLDRSALQ